MEDAWAVIIAVLIVISVAHLVKWHGEESKRFHEAMQKDVSVQMKARVKEAEEYKDDFYDGCYCDIKTGRIQRGRMPISGSPTNSNCAD